jgi:hypothetical protein
VELFRGRAQISLRNYFRNGEGKWLPTQKGVTLGIKEWRTLIREGEEIDAAVARLSAQAG